MDTTIDTAAPLRPWIASYPEGIAWDVDHRYRARCMSRCWPPAPATPPPPRSISSAAPPASAISPKRSSPLPAPCSASSASPRARRVALMLPNTPFYPIAYYGVLRAGGTVVNCNPLYTVHELSHITANAGADVLVTLDLKQIFEKAEALVEAGTSNRWSSATSPMRCRWSRRSSIRSPSAKICAKPGASPHRRHASPASTR